MFVAKVNLFFRPQALFPSVVSANAGLGELWSAGVALSQHLGLQRTVLLHDASPKSLDLVRAARQDTAHLPLIIAHTPLPVRAHTSGATSRSGNIDQQIVNVYKNDQVSRINKGEGNDHFFNEYIQTSMPSFNRDLLLPSLNQYPMLYPRENYKSDNISNNIVNNDMNKSGKYINQAYKSNQTNFKTERNIIKYSDYDDDQVVLPPRALPKQSTMATSDETELWFPCAKLERVRVVSRKLLFLSGTWHFVSSVVACGEKLGMFRTGELVWVLLDVEIPGNANEEVAQTANEEVAQTAKSESQTNNIFAGRRANFYRNKVFRRNKRLAELAFVPSHKMYITKFSPTRRKNINSHIDNIEITNIITQDVSNIEKTNLKNNKKIKHFYGVRKSIRNKIDLTETNEITEKLKRTHRRKTRFSDERNKNNTKTSKDRMAETISQLPPGVINIRLRVLGSIDAADSKLKVGNSYEAVFIRDSLEVMSELVVLNDAIKKEMEDWEQEHFHRFHQSKDDQTTNMESKFTSEIENDFRENTDYSEEIVPYEKHYDTNEGNDANESPAGGENVYKRNKDDIILNRTKLTETISVEYDENLNAYDDVVSHETDQNSNIAEDYEDLLNTTSLSTFNRNSEPYGGVDILIKSDIMNIQNNTSFTAETRNQSTEENDRRHTLLNTASKTPAIYLGSQSNVATDTKLPMKYNTVTKIEQSIEQDGPVMVEHYDSNTSSANVNLNRSKSTVSSDKIRNEDLSLFLHDSFSSSSWSCEVPSEQHSPDGDDLHTGQGHAGLTPEALKLLRSRQLLIE